RPQQGRRAVLPAHALRAARQRPHPTPDELQHVHALVIGGAVIDIPTLIRDQHARRRDLQALERYVLEDQWAGGDGWTGPKPIDLDTRLEANVLTLIEAKFVARNVLAEVITRHR